MERRSIKNEILTEGYGYRTYLQNFSDLLDKIGVSQDDAYKHFKNKILMEPYEDIHESAIEFLQ